MAQKIPITCPKCGKSQFESTKGFDPEKRPVVCRACGNELDSEEVRQQLIKISKALIKELQANIRSRK